MAAKRKVVPKLSVIDVVYAYVAETGHFPSLAQAQRLAKIYTSIADVREFLRRWEVQAGHPFTGLAAPDPALRKQLAQHMTASSAWMLDVPELATVLVKGAVEGLAPNEFQAALAATTYWKTHNETQRGWDELTNPADREALIQKTAASVAEQLRDLYGPAYAQAQGWSPSSAQVRQWASALASGTLGAAKWSYEQRAAAEQIEGTPAWRALQAEARAAGEVTSQIENTRGRLEETWREWMGPSGAPDLAAWARDIVGNVRSEQDFLDFVRQQSESLYPQKPPGVTYRQYVEPAKSMVAQMLELGAVDDRDALIDSYVRGQIPSLADLRNRVMVDPRLDRTQWFRQQQMQVAENFVSRFGLGIL